MRRSRQWRKYSAIFEAIWSNFRSITKSKPVTFHFSKVLWILKPSKPIYARHNSTTSSNLLDWNGLAQHQTPNWYSINRKCSTVPLFISFTAVFLLFLHLWMQFISLNIINWEMLINVEANLLAAVWVSSCHQDTGTLVFFKKDDYCKTVRFVLCRFPFIPKI